MIELRVLDPDDWPIWRDLMPDGERREKVLAKRLSENLVPVIVEPERP